jgi:hypothetical protein
MKAALCAFFIYCTPILLKKSATCMQTTYTHIFYQNNLLADKNMRFILLSFERAADPKGTKRILD